MDKKTARDFYTLKTSEYPATIFARVDDGDRNKNTCMQCDNPLESKILFAVTIEMHLMQVLFQVYCSKFVHFFNQRENTKSKVPVIKWLIFGFDQGSSHVMDLVKHSQLNSSTLHR